MVYLSHLHAAAGVMCVLRERLFVVSKESMKANRSIIEEQSGGLLSWIRFTTQNTDPGRGSQGFAAGKEVPWKPKF